SGSRLSRRWRGARKFPHAHRKYTLRAAFGRRKARARRDQCKALEPDGAHYPRRRAGGFAPDDSDQISSLSQRVDHLAASRLAGGWPRGWVDTLAGVSQRLGRPFMAQSELADWACRRFQFIIAARLTRDRLLLILSQRAPRLRRSPNLTSLFWRRRRIFGFAGELFEFCDFGIRKPARARAVLRIEERVGELRHLGAVLGKKVRASLEPRV